MVASLMGARMKYCGLLVFILLGVVPLTGWGQVLSDPTRPPFSIGDTTISSGQMPLPQVRGLQSVIISPAHCAAIIDGKTVILGAKHGSERLIEITEQGVVLQGGNGLRRLTLFPAVGMKMTEALPLNQQAVKCRLEQNRQVKNPAIQAGQKEKK